MLPFPSPIRRAVWLALVTACGCGDAPPASGPPVVLVSVLPQAFFIERIAGQRVAIEVLIPPGANPATHEPGFEQLRAAAAASLYLKVGHPQLPFEATWLDELTASAPRLRVVTAWRNEAHLAGDPHVWVSPRGARHMARASAEALVALLPDEAAELLGNLGRLEAEIDAVDAELAALLGPLRGGRFYVLHPAWGHLADAYGLEQVAIERLGREPDPAWLADLIRRARSDAVRVIFAQPQFSARGAELVAAEIGARVELLDPLAYDWTDNLRSVGRSLAEAVSR